MYRHPPAVGGVSAGGARCNKAGGGRAARAAMEPEPEESAAAGHAQPSAEEEPTKGRVAVTSIAGHQVTADATTLDASEWKLMAAQVREVKAVFPKLLCLRELILDGVPVSGSAPKDGYSNFRYGVETPDADLDTFQALCEGLRVRPTLTSLSLKKCYLGPQALALLADLISMMAALASLTLDRNGIFGELDFSYTNPVRAVDKYVAEVESFFVALKSSNITSLSLTLTGMGPKTCRRLATSLSAVLEKVVLSHNFIFGSKDEASWDKAQIHDIDADQSGWSALCAALPASPVEELDVSDIGMGVTGVTSLTKAISAGAVLASLNLSGNMITDYDRDLSGLSALGEAIVPSKTLASIDLSNCGIEVKGVTEVAKFISAGAVLAEVVVGSNPFGGMALSAEAQVKRGVRTDVELEDGIYASYRGKFGRVTSSWGDGCRLTMLDAASETSNIDASDLGDRVAQITDLEGLDYGHIQQLGQAVTRLTKLDISECGFNPVSLATLVESVTWETAVLARVSVLSNPIGTDGADALIQVFEQNTKLRTLLGIEEGVNELNLSEKNVDPGQAKILAAELKASRATAVLKEIALDGCPLTGATKKYSSDAHFSQNIDSQMDGFVALCSFLGKLHKVSLSNCGLGTTSTAELAKVFSDPSAALKKVVISHNKLFGQKSRDNDGRPPYVHDVDGDQSGWTALCDSLPGSPVEEFIAVDVGMGPKGVTSLAKAISAGAVLAHLVICQNKIGSEGGTALVEAIKTSNLESISIGKNLVLPINGELDSPTLDASNQDIDPGYVMILAWWLSTPASAVLASLTLDQNGIFGELYPSGNCKEADKYVEESAPLLDAIKTSNLTSLSLSKTGIGPIICSRLATSLSAVLTSLTVSHNDIGGTLASLVDGAKTGVTVKKGVFAAVAGRWGEVTDYQQNYDFLVKRCGPSPHVKMGWLDSAEQSEWYTASKLNPVVSSRAHLVEDDYSHIEQLGQAITRLTDLDISNCNFTPASIKNFISSVAWTEAALNSVTLDSNSIFGIIPRYGADSSAQPDKFADDCDVFLATLKESNILTLSLQNTGIGPLSLRKLAISLPAVLNSLTLNSTGREYVANTYTLTAGEDRLDLSEKNLGPADVKFISVWLATDAGAAVARLMLNGNMVTGSREKRYNGSGDWEYDKDISGLISLCDTLPTLKNPIDLDLSDCGLSVNGVNPVANAIQAGSVGAIGLAGCQVEPPMVAQVLSVASEVSRSRLRVAQVLAFCCALHDRMGADSAIHGMFSGVVEIWQIVASIVHARRGHEALCSTLGCKNPWYEVCVRGLVPEGVPHS
eukprot:COSAG01_NODE_4186_length_5260_cov_5.388684_3_plen_1312_part_00